MGAFKPDHIPAFLTYGKLLAKNKTRHTEAETWFLKAARLAPGDPGVHLHYGLFLMEAGAGRRDLEAAREFETASSLEPTDYNAAFNAGVAYRQAGHRDKAEEFYRKAARISPKDPSAHMNLGAMLHLVGKLREAENHYLTAWKLNPGDQPTKTNLDRLHNIMRAKRIPFQPLN